MIFGQCLWAKRAVAKIGDEGIPPLEVRDMKMTSAAFLYNVAEETFWEDEMISENRIYSSTSTPLESIRSAEAAYTSGYNDDKPGLHPGHTPYYNMDDWASGMIMGRPSWMADQGHPPRNQWPAGELWFNTDYVRAHSEFTPQQTMRGKQALYGYLYRINRGGDVSIARESEKGSSANSIGNGYFFFFF